MHRVVVPNSYTGCVSALGVGDAMERCIDAVMSICDKPLSLEECMRDAAALIEAGAARLCRIVRASRTVR